MSHGTFARPDLTTFTCLDELGLEVVAQRVGPGQASLVCRVVDPDEWCHRGGVGQGHPAAGSCPVRVAAHDVVLAGTGPARLLDMIEAAPKRGWHSAPKAWCDGAEVVAMDGFTWSTTATSEELPTANRDGSDGPAPCRPPCPGRPGPMPAPRPTRTPRARQLPPQNAPHCRRTPPPTMKNP